MWSVFEYNAKFHNVMRVTSHAMYKSCNATSPLTTLSTGNDTIKITNYGHHFFLCGVPGHCQAGQKVDINVVKVSTSATATPSPSPSSAMASQVPSSNGPAPSPNNAASFIVVEGVVGFMGLAMPLLALALSCYAWLGFVLVVKSLVYAAIWIFYFLLFNTGTSQDIF